MKIVFPFIFALIISSCGSTQQQSAIGVEEETMLILRSEVLVGASVQLDDYSPVIITRDQLTSYKTGIFGASNSENEDLETATFKVNSGPHRVIVKRAGVTVLSRDLQFLQGQVREIRIRE